MMFRSRLFGGGPGGDEILDRPLSNFDIIGIPTGMILKYDIIKMFI